MSLDVGIGQSTHRRWAGRTPSVCGARLWRGFEPRAVGRSAVRHASRSALDLEARIGHPYRHRSYVRGSAVPTPRLLVGRSRCRECLAADDHHPTEPRRGRGRLPPVRRRLAPSDGGLAVDGGAAGFPDTLTRATPHDTARTAAKVAQPHRSSFLEGGHHGGYEPDPHRTGIDTAPHTELMVVDRHSLRPRPEHKAGAAD